MLLNYAGKIILRTPKHDKCVLIRKWCSKVPKKKIVRTRTGEFRIYKELIMDKLQLDKGKAVEFLKINDYILQVPMEKIIKISKICQHYKVNLSYTTCTKLQLFQLSEAEVKTRILILKEMGVRYLVPIMLNSTNQFVNTKIFRIFACIDNKQDIAERLYSYLHDPPPEVPPLEKLDENMSIRAFRSKCLSHYLQWRLKISPEDNIFLNKMVLNLINKSFDKVRKSFDILHDHVGISVETIRDERCLENCSPDDLKLILTRIKTICGVPIIKLLKSAPILSRMRYTNVIAAKRLLEKSKYTGEQLVNCPKILLINKRNLSDVSDLINKNVELKIFHNHPKIFYIFLLENQLDLRMEYLKYLNVKNISVSMLTKSALQFDKATRVGKLVYNIYELSWIIKQYLSLDILDIKKSLSRHPFWNRIDLLTIHDTLKYLATNFNADAIKNNLQIVLYSKEQIAQALMNIIDTYHICSPENPYTTSQIIALCEYELEKEYHFTGDGVWDKDVKNVIPRVYVQLSIILSNKQNRRNLFINNPNDYFYNYLDNIDINSKIDDNVDDNDDDNNTNDDDDYCNNEYNDKFNDDYDDKLQFNNTNKT